MWIKEYLITKVNIFECIFLHTVHNIYLFMRNLNCNTETASRLSVLWCTVYSFALMLKHLILATILKLGYKRLPQMITDVKSSPLLSLLQSLEIWFYPSTWHLLESSRVHSVCISVQTSCKVNSLDVRHPTRMWHQSTVG